MGNRLIGNIFAIMLCGIVLSVVSCTEERVSEPKPDSKIVKKVKTIIVYRDEYGIDLAGLEKAHPFDIRKYRRIFDKLTVNGGVSFKEVLSPDEISEKDILRVHTESFLENLKSSATLSSYLEAPLLQVVPNAMLDKGVLKPFRYATGGTLLASRWALKTGIAINLGGGYHHAKPEVGEGFCIYADMPIAIRVLQSEGVIKRALIIDLDVHQGNGTAICLENDETTYCFSMHQGDIYPNPKEESDLDVELSSGMEDDEYLEILEESLVKVFKEAGKIDLVIYQAGCDTLKGDPLASLNMTEEGIVKRDLMVINACVNRKIPVVMTLGGGYSKNAWHVQYSSIQTILEKFPMTSGASN